MRIEMKMEKMSRKALERKSNKPIMEKKRRARINHCLNQLKALILETDNERSRHSKLEKADILEMTVRYLQTLRAYHLHLQQLHQQIHLQQQQQLSQPAQLAAQNGTNFQSAQQQQQSLSLNQLQLQLQASQLHLQQQQHQQPQPSQLQIRNTSQLQHQPHQQHLINHHNLHHAQLSPAWRPW